ncbi:MAG: type II toxin-antitoxin system HicB family antitoxin [Candidatus Saccharimonadales bacterium]
MKALALQTVVYQEGKYFVAQCLDIDVSSFGESEQGALANLHEALELYLEDTPIQSIKTEVSHPTLHTLRLKHA